MLKQEVAFPNLLLVQCHKHTLAIIFCSILWLNMHKNIWMGMSTYFWPYSACVLSFGWTNPLLWDQCTDLVSLTLPLLLLHNAAIMKFIVNIHRTRDENYKLSTSDVTNLLHAASPVLLSSAHFFASLRSSPSVCWGRCSSPAVGKHCFLASVSVWCVHLWMNARLIFYFVAPTHAYTCVSVRVHCGASLSSGHARGRLGW